MHSFVLSKGIFEYFVDDLLFTKEGSNIFIILGPFTDLQLVVDLLFTSFNDKPTTLKLYCQTVIVFVSIFIF